MSGRASGDDEGPSKADITAVFKKLRSYPSNKVCFDCGAKNPTWSSVTYGVFICIDCSAVHRGLGVHLSFVRSTQLDTNWTWLQLRAMQLGGNVIATQFFRQHGCTTTDAQQKYKSRAAQMYREKLHHQAAQAMRIHGTKLHIDGVHPEQMTPVEKDADFFEDVVDSHLSLPTVMSSSSLTDQAYIIPHAPEIKAASSDGDLAGPKVDHILDDSTNHPTELKTSSIGQRKPAAKKPAAMGGKKGGFGAQKVQADFTEIEKQAEIIDRQKEQPATVDFSAKDQSGGQVNQLSARLMVQDLGADMKKQEEKLKRMDPKKAEQVDRLGIGLASIAGGSSAKGGVSHSVMRDMKPIEQEGNASSRSTAGNQNGSEKSFRDAFEEEWEVVSGNKDSSSTNLLKSNSSYGSLYDNNSTRTNKADDFFSDFNISSSNKSASNWTTTDDSRPKRAPIEAPITDEAQKKFGKAKAISSDQFFNNAGGPSYETRTNLSRFEGSNAISSADFFGDGSSAGGGGSAGGGANANRRSYGASAAAAMPDMTEISDSVRQGVSKVAGKLSNLSRNVGSYLQDRYPGSGY